MEGSVSAKSRLISVSCSSAGILRARNFRQRVAGGARVWGIMGMWACFRGSRLSAATGVGGGGGGRAFSVWAVVGMEGRRGQREKLSKAMMARSA